VSELCQIPLETPVKQRDLRGHSDAHRCCGKSLMGSALVRVGVRQHARPESISKRAPSSTRTSLRFRINGLRAVWDQIIANSPRLPFVSRSHFDSAAYEQAQSRRRSDCVRPSNLVRSLTAFQRGRWRASRVHARRDASRWASAIGSPASQHVISTGQRKHKATERQLCPRNGALRNFIRSCRFRPNLGLIKTF
jgi:hypothetical protein